MGSGIGLLAQLFHDSIRDNLFESRLRNVFSKRILPCLGNNEPEWATVNWAWHKLVAVGFLNLELVTTDWLFLTNEYAVVGERSSWSIGNCDRAISRDDLA